MRTIRFTLTHFWKIIAGIILGAGLYVTYLRFFHGIGSVTNLSDEYPWGIWIGFDILCGVGLAAGGFTICALAHVLNLREFKPLSRPAILTAFLGYLLVIFALMFDLGKPYNIWHAIVMWNPNSVMFEVAWCVMLYTTVLFLEFSPILLERFNWPKVMAFINKIKIPVMIAGVLLSTLHQSSLGSLYLIVPQKMSRLWYSPFLPVYFYLTAIGAGMAMVIFESFLSSRAFNKGLELHLLARLANYSGIILAAVALFRFADIFLQGHAALLVQPALQTWMFYTEIILLGVIPFTLFSSLTRRVRPAYLYLGAVSVISGFLLNRLNVSITAIDSNIGYIPALGEIIVTLCMVVLGLIAFRFVARNFQVFPALREH